VIRVVTSAQSAARDTAAIAAGTPSRALMQRAGAAAAGEIALRFRDGLAHGVAIFAGPGNNGGDAWVVARALAAAGARVRVLEPLPAKTADCSAERALAIAGGGTLRIENPDAGGALHDGGESIVIDGLLGTGASGEPRGAIADALRTMHAMRERGATIVALDLPSGLDATTGSLPASTVRADLTLTFGTIKRGLARNRQCCGMIVALDIGLGASARLDDGAASLVDEAWVASVVPAFAASSHKGTRKKLVIIGGHEGMAGAAVLAARSALRSGIGMVRVLVDRPSLSAVQEAEPAALAGTWPESDGSDQQTLNDEILNWADAVVVGPGLGRGAASRAVLDRVLDAWRGPTLLDADAITAFAGNLPDLARRLDGRPALLTPHVVELARLTGAGADDVIARPFEASRDAARALGATVLLKGVPTIVSAASGAQLVSATGTPALATGGSGDVLSGIAGTLLAQIADPLAAGAAAAWVHGRAAERVPSAGGAHDARGITLDDIVAELRDAWTFDVRPLRYPVLAELPAVGA
jgi:NAD(P)H-hydrate epimerase